jgi:hypothetical protein
MLRRVWVRVRVRGMVWVEMQAMATLVQALALVLVRMLGRLPCLRSDF